MSADTSDLSRIRDEDLLRKMVRNGYSMLLGVIIGMHFGKHARLWTMGTLVLVYGIDSIKPQNIPIYPAWHLWKSGFRLNV